MAFAGPLERPRVSRETRRLLGVAAIALIALWGLARLRFPDTPVAANPVPPLLAQLAPPARFSELATELAAVSTRIRDALVVVRLHGDDGRVPRLALRTGPGTAATVLRRTNPDTAVVAADALIRDRPSGLTLVASDRPEPVSLPRAWQPPQPVAAYLVAAVPGPADTIDVEPVFVSSWAPRWSRAWNDDLWVAPRTARLTAGTFLFTAAGELAGVAVLDRGEMALLPADGLYAAIASLSSARDGAGSGWLGVSGTTLTPRLAAATGATTGVLVVAVDQQSPAHTVIMPGDVVTAVNDVAITSLEDWSAIVDRTRPGDALRVTVASGTTSRTVEVATTAAPPDPPSPLGLRLRRADGRTEILSVESRSAAANAGLRAGDVITRAGTIDQPTPAEITRQFTRATETPLLILFSRGGTPAAAALER